MNQQIVIRYSNGSDANALWELIRDHARYEGHDLSESNQLKLLETQTHSATIFVVEVNNIIVGYMSLIKQFSTWDMRHYVYMDCLYLTPDFRGKGIGKMLLDKASDYATDQGLPELQWQTPINNIGAINFYIRNGATSKDKKRFFWTNSETQ